MVQEEKDIRDNFVSSCNKLKQDAKNKLNEKLNTFNISDCEDILNKIKKFSNSFLWISEEGIISLIVIYLKLPPNTCFSQNFLITDECE